MTPPSLTPPPKNFSFAFNPFSMEDTWEIRSLYRYQLEGLCFGDPQTCVYPDVCLVIGDRLSQDKGPGRCTKCLPCRPTDSLGRGGRGGVSTRYLAPGGGVSQLQCQSVNRRKPKGDGGKGREKCFTTICDKRHDNLRHLTTFYDNFRLFVPLT